MSGKQYVGQTKNVKKRIENHLQGKGSKGLLQDVVKQGIKDFKFEVIETVETDVDVVEDSYIYKYNCLHPIGYNMRTNVTIIANDEEVDLNCIGVQAKFCFTNNEHQVFSIDEFTQARSYQVLANIKENTQASLVTKKKMFNFSYFELRVNSDDPGVFEQGQIYDLCLKYNFHDDIFTLV